MKTYTLKPNEYISSKTPTRECNACNIIFDVNINNFPKSSSRKKDDIIISYLRSVCRKCWITHKTNKKPTIKQTRECALNYYHKNRDKYKVYYNKRKIKNKIEKMLKKRLIL